MTKTRILLISLLSVFALTATQASAQKPIPGITATAQYKELQRNVNVVLASKKDTPVSANGRQKYRNGLNARTTNVYNRIRSLTTQRYNRTKKQNMNQMKRANQKVKAQSKKQLNKINAQYKANLDADERAYHAAVSAIQRSYAPQTNRYRSQITNLKRRLAKAKNPVVRADIQDQITKAQFALSRVLDRQNDDISEAKRRFDAEDRDDLAARNRAVRKLNQATAARLAQVRNTYRQKYQARSAQVSAKNQSERSLTAQLHARGEGFIEDMPPVS